MYAWDNILVQRVPIYILQLYRKGLLPFILKLPAVLFLTHPLAHPAQR